jgi:hypothetical protein
MFGPVSIQVEDLALWRIEPSCSKQAKSLIATSRHALKMAARERSTLLQR